MIPFLLAVATIAPEPMPAVYRPAIDTYVIDDLFIDPQIRIDGSAHRGFRLSASLMKGAE
jgi:hypothetical protein